MVTHELYKEATASRDAGRSPRIHPNGFIQLDLNSDLTRRLHVWDKSLPRQDVYTPIHNHEFSFHSTVFRGMLKNIMYQMNEEGPNPHVEWTVQRETNSAETKLVKGVSVVHPMVTGIQLIKEGETYQFPEGAFHESDFEDHTISVIEKGTYNPNIKAAVLVPEGSSPDNNFVRAGFDVGSLWKIIESTLIR